MKVLHSICQQIWKTQQWPQDWKRSVFIPIPKKGNAKEYSNYCTVVPISQASKVMLKILQGRLDLEKTEEPEIQLPTSNGSSEQQESSRKTSTSVLLTMPKPLAVWIKATWKILQEIRIPDHLTFLLKNLYAGQEATVRTWHGTIDWFQLGKKSTSRLYVVTLLI